MILARFCKPLSVSGPYRFVSFIICGRNNPEYVPPLVVARLAFCVYRWTFFCKLAMMSVALPVLYATPVFVFYTLLNFLVATLACDDDYLNPPILSLPYLDPATRHRHLPHVSIHTLL